MFGFFRRNTALIGWSIVGFFGVTMFSGSVFFGFDALKNRGEKPPQQSSSQFVSLGAYDVDIRSFYQQYQGGISQYKQVGHKMSPLVHEQLLMQSLGYAINQQVYYIAAQEEGFKVIKQEINSVEQDYLLNMNMKSRAELKKMLKEKKVPYKDFQVQLERDALIRKFQAQYASNVTMNAFVIDNSFKQFQVDYFVVQQDSLSLDLLTKQADAIVSSLNSKVSLESLIKTYEGIVSINIYPKSEFQDYLGFDPFFRKQLVNLDENDYLEPYCRLASCTILRLLDVQFKPKPEDYNEDEYAKSLRESLQQEALNRRMGLVLVDHPLVVHDSVLKAVYFKNQGELVNALNAYQEISSLSPSDPAPHFFRAEIFVRQGKSSVALEELQKAVLKAQMLPDTDFAELHIFYGDLLLADKRRDEGFSHYEIAFDLVQDNSDLLSLLKERYKTHLFDDQLKKIDDRIAALKLEKEKQDEVDRQELQALLATSDDGVTSSVLVSDSEESPFPTITETEH